MDWHKQVLALKKVGLGSLRIVSLDLVWDKLFFKIKQETTVFGEAEVNLSPNFDYLL